MAAEVTNDGFYVRVRNEITFANCLPGIRGQINLLSDFAYMGVESIITWITETRYHKGKSSADWRKRRCSEMAVGGSGVMIYFTKCGVDIHRRIRSCIRSFTHPCSCIEWPCGESYLTLQGTEYPLLDYEVVLS